MARYRERRQFAPRKLSEHRKARRLSQYDLGKLVREQRPDCHAARFVSQAIVAACEQGAIVPDANLLLTFAAVLEVPLDDLTMRLPPIAPPADLRDDTEEMQLWKAAGVQVRASVEATLVRAESEDEPKRAA